MNKITQICPTCRQQLDPGAGYRLLSVGEIRTAGDEYYSYGMWRTMRKNLLTHRLQSNSLPTRRKIESPVVPPYPGNGYRLLSLGELFRPGDEVLAVNQVWHPILIPYAGAHMRTDSRPTRRKIEAPVEVPPYPGDGYRLLTVGEIRKFGDEAFVIGVLWIPTGFEETPLRPDSRPTRRKISVSSHNHATDSGQRACPVCSGNAVDGHVVVTHPKVDPGAGYRLLAVGEVRQKGDEYLTRGKWEGPTADVGHPVFNHSWPYRRKISPKQYRLMAVGEMTERTDEVWDYPSVDRPGVWRKLGWRFSVVTDSYSPVRREIDSYIGGPA